MHGGAARTLHSVNTTERDLWIRAKQGDGEAFAGIYDLHGARVLRHSIRLVGSLHDAQDVAATAFMELWRKRETVRVVEDSVVPWLILTTTNVALNHSRARRRYAALLDRLPRERDEHNDLGSAVLGDAMFGVDPALVLQIHDLPRKDQELLALVALEDYSLADAARALSISEQAARSRWQRLRRRLAGRLATAAPDSARISLTAGGTS